MNLPSARLKQRCRDCAAVCRHRHCLWRCACHCHHGEASCKKPNCRFGAIAAAVLAAVPPLASAQVFGSLDNFDVVNTTGHTAYGFEIEIEDVSFDHPGRLGSIFG